MRDLNINYLHLTLRIRFLPQLNFRGTYAPTYIRLCVHASATYDARDGTGGLEGACMRFAPEKTDAHNKGLYHVIQRLDKEVKSKHPWISHADLWCLTAYVCIECAGGPVMEFVPGKIFFWD